MVYCLSVKVSFSYRGLPPHKSVGMPGIPKQCIGVAGVVLLTKQSSPATAMIANVRVAQCSPIGACEDFLTLKAFNNIAQGRVANPGLRARENRRRAVRRPVAFACPSRNVTDVATSNAIRLMVSQLLVAFAVIGNPGRRS